MDWAVRVAAFYRKSSADNRISPVHISLYFALLDAVRHAFTIPIFLQRDSIMEKAKISSRVTYNRCVRDLHNYGYIDYMPSFIPGRSMVSLISLE